MTALELAIHKQELQRLEKEIAGQIKLCEACINSCASVVRTYAIEVNDELVD